MQKGTSGVLMGAVALGAIALGAFGTGGCSGRERGGGLFGGAEEADYATVDLDQNGRVAPDELAGWAEEVGVVDSWDTDGQPGIGPLELARGFYALWDEDGGGLSEAEWSQGLHAWYPKAKDYGTFADWDLDGDGTIHEDELYAGLSHTKLLASWMGDRGHVDPEDVYRHMFEVFDTNGDHVVTEQEWRGGLTRWNFGL
jgi:hypothetical protein